MANPSWSGSTSVTSRSGASYTAKITITVNCAGWKYVGIGSYATQSFARQYIYWTNGGSGKTWSTTSSGTSLAGTTVTFGTYYLNAQQYTGGSMTNITSRSWSVTIPAAKFTVTLNANGGTCSVSSFQATYNSTYGSANLPDPVRSGYRFLGWYTTQTDGTQITGSTQVKIEANSTFWAHWEALGYNIYPKSGSSTPVNVKQIYVKQGSTISQCTGAWFKQGSSIINLKMSDVVIPKTNVTLSSLPNEVCTITLGGVTYDTVTLNSSGTGTAYIPMNTSLTYSFASSGATRTVSISATGQTIIGAYVIYSSGKTGYGYSARTVSASKGAYRNNAGTTTQTATSTATVTSSGVPVSGTLKYTYTGSLSCQSDMSNGVMSYNFNGSSTGSIFGNSVNTMSVSSSGGNTKSTSTSGSGSKAYTASTAITMSITVTATQIGQGGSIVDGSYTLSQIYVI